MREPDASRSRRLRFLLPGAAMAFLSLAAAALPELPGFDFRSEHAVREWSPAHDVAPLRSSAGGMAVAITGDDPYVIGPPRDFPPDRPLWATLRIRAEQPGGGQLFYFRDHPREEASVRFAVRAGAWEEVRLPLPPLGPGYRFRLDPPGRGGTAVIAWLRFEVRPLIAEPDWPPPEPPPPGQALELRSGDLLLRHADRLGGFSLEVAGEPMAIGHTRPLIGYLRDGRPRWLDFGLSQSGAISREGNALVVDALARDGDGASWRIRQRFSPGGVPGSLSVETRLSVDRERSVLFAPMLLLFPGAGSFGEAKGQGLFAGLEYLDNEPSSSEADLTGPAARRQVPDTIKITFPLMAIQAKERYVGLTWEPGPDFCALFDSPDRLFRSRGHVLGILFPGSDGVNREEGRLLPYDGRTLSPGAPVTLRAVLLGGKGGSVVPAVRQYVALRGLPAVPQTGLDRRRYAALAAAGWLDSAIRGPDGTYRHAYPGGFPPQPAADAAVWQAWLASQGEDRALAARLDGAAREALAQVAPAEYLDSGVSHVRPPVAPLLFGHVSEAVERSRAAGRELLRRFEPDGTVLFRPAPGRPDFGRTHFARHANGLTAQTTASLLESAAFTGDPDLRREALRLLSALDRYGDGVPRGAQTWEIPLHTPDILASAHLVRACTLGYELSGDPRFRERALYWAWTGVPFVYLSPPTDRPVGLYATIAVFGATHWKTPVWLGLPVQWCGLVYADALYRLARHDPSGPWKRLADGITASGIQQTFPAGSDRERQGLLPDSFQLRAQLRQDPAINPGTVQACAVRFFGGPELYDFRAFPKHGLFVHAPGRIAGARQDAAGVRFRVEGWRSEPYFVLAAGLRSPVRVRIDGREIDGEERALPGGALAFSVSGNPLIEIRLRESAERAR